MQVLHSKILGKGEPLIILHGFLGMSDNWKTLGSSYAENGFEVHLLDQRNHGRSFHSKEFDYDLMVKDLKAYMDENSIEKASLIGHSMGGKTAMFFACQHPERTEKLLVADIAPRAYEPHHQHIFKGLQSIDLNKISSRNEASSALEKHIKEWGIRQFLLKNLYRKGKDEYGFRFNLPVLASSQEDIGQALPENHRFSGPTLFLKGDRSDYITEKDHKDISSHFPESDIKSIEGAGHWLHAEKPDEFFELSSAFLKS
ncbi:alpha/beta fold hydrolase [Robertkochia aurantiaca]|uniref:alpha/beta fold hydrolase n=1 Tax=Robertkochia aurantiaca TaxID=2873700 RepID=UPI001CCA6016|nr:alpha/beta fold hydrolase [Robertkochia sp. 3YJGBD-33]